MSKIDGITPHKKYESFKKRRATPSPHHEIRARHLSQQRIIAVIVGVSIVALVAVWIILARSGVLFSNTDSDSTFVESLTEEFQDTSVTPQTIQNLTPQEQELLQNIDKELFPEFH